MKKARKGLYLSLKENEQISLYHQGKEFLRITERAVQPKSAEIFFTAYCKSNGVILHTCSLGSFSSKGNQFRFNFPRELVEIKKTNIA